MFGRIWGEYGTSVYQLIAEAHGETWDEEDEEKHCWKKEIWAVNGPVAEATRRDVADMRFTQEKKEAAVNQRKDDDLARTREEDPCGREHEFQGITEESVSVLEEEKGQGEGGAVLRSSEEEAPQKARGKGRGGRGDGFYSRAGGT